MYGRPGIGPPPVTGATAGWSLAERVGFEPTMSFWAHTPLAGERLQPGSATSPRAGMLPAAPRPRTPADTLRHGGMAERTIATVLKTVEPHGFGGSNPPPSATGLPSPGREPGPTQSRMRVRRSASQSSAERDVSEASWRTASPLEPAAG